MAYLDASTNEGIAEFLADFNLEIRHEEPGDQIGHVKYSCTLTERDQSFYTFYQHDPRVHGVPTVADVMYALASDAMMAVDYEIDDFADEMGFTKPSEAIRAYEGCQKALNWFSDDLGIGTRSLNKLELALDENLDEIKGAVQKLIADRQAKYEHAHPKPPEGFVTIEDLQKDLDLGAWGDQIEPGYYDLSEAFNDCADSNVDVYYSDMFKWLPDNYEWIAAAKAEGLLEGVKGNLIKMIQSAQYLAIRQNLYDHQDDILKNLVLESLKEDGIYALSEDMVDDILDGCDSTDWIDILVDKAKDVISDSLEEGKPIAMSVEEVREASGKNAKAVSPSELSSLTERCDGAKEASRSSGPDDGPALDPVAR